MRKLLVPLLLLLPGCPASTYSCVSDEECATASGAGHCVSNGEGMYCAVPSASCDTGYAFASAPAGTPLCAHVILGPVKNPNPDLAMITAVPVDAGAPRITDLSISVAPIISDLSVVIVTPADFSIGAAPDFSISAAPDFSISAAPDFSITASPDLSGDGAAPTCSDGKRNGDETDVDCGGSCRHCPIGGGCTKDADCWSNNCVAGVCGGVRDFGLLGEKLQVGFSINGGSGMGTSTGGGGVTLQQVKLGDFNNDHFLDIAVVDQYSYSIFVFPGDGTGDFSNSKPIETLVGSNQLSRLAVGDLDGDKNLDAVMSGGDTLYFLYGRGDGTFAVVNQPLQSGAQAAFNLSGVAFANLDGHAPLDVVSADSAANGVFVVLRDGTQPADAQPSVVGTTIGFYPTGPGPASVAIGDFDADGHLDVAAANADSTFTPLYNHKGDGALDGALPPLGQPSGALNAPDEIVAGLFARIVTDGGVGPGAGIVYADPINSLVGTFDGIPFSPTPVTTLLGGQLTPFGITADDMDLDGHLDVVTVDTDAGIMAVLIGKGDGTFKDPAAAATTTQYPTGYLPQFLATGDLNGDHLPDVVVSNVGDGSLSIFVNISK